MHFAGDKREARPGQRRHREHSQHGDVSMPGTDQYHVLENGMHHWLHTTLRASMPVSLGASDRRVGMVSIRSRRRSPRESESTAMDSKAVAMSSTMATSSLNSEMAASM